jgi:hypothetical protein
METTTRLELKYCEGCGALCLRPSDQPSPYCEKCDTRMAQISRKVRGTKGGRQ